MKTIYAQLGRSSIWWEDRLLRLRESSPLVVASGISPRLWRLYAQAWLVCLLFPILRLVRQPLWVQLPLGSSMMVPECRS